MSAYNKQILLESIVNIAPGSGTAEQESDDDDKFLKNFLPIPDYRHVLDPNILLVLGGRGAGKTELFRLLAIPTGRESLVASLGVKSLPDLAQTTWIAGFGRTRKKEQRFPIPETVEKEMANATNISWRSFWIGLVIRVLLQQEKFKFEVFLHDRIVRINPDLIRLLKEELSRLSMWKSMVDDHLEELNAVLDELDNQLTKSDDWLFVTYDELDLLVASYTALAMPIRELLALWLDRSRRWDRIRPKIFLRVDLFRDNFLSFSDASKLKAHQTKLEWKHSWLYQLLVKRLANSSNEMQEYLQEISGLIGESKTELGLTASLSEELFEKIIERMIGKYMGANAKKGITYRWIPNHLQDAGGRIAPRSFLKLFSLAAQQRMDNISSITQNTVLLQPSDLQGALMKTSEDRIQELQEEYPWLESLKTSLVDLTAPIQKDILLERVAATHWISAKQQPPVSTPEGILQYLLQLGIVESRFDGRINMPEIYLYGFGVKRKGGVQRPQ